MQLHALQSNAELSSDVTAWLSLKVVAKARLLGA
jgi:hypothetical protein